MYRYPHIRSGIATAGVGGLKIKLPQIINDLNDIGVRFEYIKSVRCIFKTKKHMNSTHLTQAQLNLCELHQ